MRIMVSGSTKTVHRIGKLYPRSVGILLAPRNWNGVESILSTSLQWAADNGCYRGFEEERFLRMVERIAGKEGLQWVVAPDVVANARSTLFQFEVWEPILRRFGCPVALVAQDGQESLPVPWDRLDCLFIGGSTWWKVSQHAADLMGEAKSRGKLVHVGRVNTLRRLRMAFDRGADSVDGSCFSRWSDKLLLWAVHYLGRLKDQPIFEEPQWTTGPDA